MARQRKNAPIPVGVVSGNRESIWKFYAKSELRPGAASVWEYDWARPGGMKKPEGETSESHEGGFEDETNHPLERAEVDEKMISGASNVIELGAGGRFALDCEPRAQYVTISAHHVFSSEHRRDRPGADDLSEVGGYRNDFECLPLDVPFRMKAAARRPKIEGSLLATVVGPKGQDVHTDSRGRVRIRFDWGRKENESRCECWARVLRTGTGEGLAAVPRIGMEVLVQFVEGDPEKPVVVGWFGCEDSDVNKG